MEAKQTDYLAEQYSAMVAYYIYEANTFWVRSAFFATFQIAAIGFFATMIEKLHDPKTPPMLFIGTFCVALAGTVGLAIWKKATEMGFLACNHWLSCVDQLETQMFPEDKQYFRTRPKYEKSFGLRTTVKQLILLLGLIWVLFLIDYALQIAISIQSINSH